MDIRKTLRESPRLRYGLAIFFGILFATLSSYSDLFVPILFGVLAFVLIALITALVLPAMLLSGYVVMRSLVLVSAGLSLIIFLAQAYCALPGTTAEGKSSLGVLVAASFAYIAFEFARKLWKAWRKTFKPLHDQERSKEKIIILIVLILCVSYFIWVIYQVIAPITASLCIYQ